MAYFTNRENEELLLSVKDLTGRVILPVEPLETPFKELCSTAVQKECPLGTAADAMVLNDMFASFLNCGKRGYVIAVSGGFGSDGLYHIVGAGNTGSKGVLRPSDKQCAALAQACTNFILGSTGPPDPDDMSEILVAAFDICSAEKAHRLEAINTSENITTQSVIYVNMLQGLRLPPQSDLRPDIDVLKEGLRRWRKLGSEEKTKLATIYGRCLELIFNRYDKKIDFESVQVEPNVKLIRGFYNIAKGLRLLRNFPRGMRVVFDWPQGPMHMNGDPFRIGDYRRVNAHLYKNRQLHCEIYLALHILFSNSDVRFHLFLVEERKQVFTIGCSKASCIACWDILLGLSRQDSPSHTIYTCRTRRSSGKCYKTWGLTPHIETLPLSLVQAITGPRRAQMLKSLNLALRCCHQKFKQRFELSVNL